MLDIQPAKDGPLVITGNLETIAAVILFIAREPIAELFQATWLTRSIIFLFCGPLALAYFFDGSIFAANVSFNNLGRPSYTAWLNWGRNTVGMLPFVLLGAAWFGALGVLIGQALGGAVFAGIAIILAFNVIQRDDLSVESDPYRKQSRIQALFCRARL